MNIRSMTSLKTTSDISFVHQSIRDRIQNEVRCFVSTYLDKISISSNKEHEYKADEHNN